MKIKSAGDFDLFKRLDEIDCELQDFHISAYKCDLLYKEQNSLKTELRQRGYKIKPDGKEKDTDNNLPAKTSFDKFKHNMRISKYTKKRKLIFLQYQMMNYSPTDKRTTYFSKTHQTRVSLDDWRNYYVYVLRKKNRRKIWMGTTETSIP